MWWALWAGCGLVGVGAGLKLWQLRYKRRKRVTEEQRSEAIRQKKEMEDLTSLPGWKTFVNAVNAQMKYRMDEITLSPELPDPRSKYLLGEVAGMKTMVAIPEVLIQANDAVVKAAMEQEGE